jgi:hypothetical protein
MNVTIQEEVLDTIEVSSDYICVDTDVELSGAIAIDIFKESMVISVDMEDGISTVIDVDIGSVIFLGNDYGSLENKPKINGVSLVGDKSFQDLDLHTISTAELLNILV